MILDAISPREGGEKTRWVKVGVGFPNGNATRVLLDAYPAPNAKGEIIIILKERKEDVSKKDEA